MQRGIGRLEVVCGSMFSGKTEELVRRLRRADYAKQQVLTLKHHLDKRRSVMPSSLTTHQGTERFAYMVGDNALGIQKMLELVTDDIHVIGIDEGQFFEFIPYISKMLVCLGKKVIIAALNGDFEQKPFDCVSKLYPLADTITKLDAVCHYCHGTANFSKRISTDTEKEVIGGADKYVAVCRKCFHSSQEKLH